jgi:hypothetical protein
VVAEETAVWRLQPLDQHDLEVIEEFRLDDGSLCRYPHTDLGKLYGLQGKSLVGWIAAESGAIVEARLNFADGSAVVCEYDCRTGQDSIRFQPVGAN